MPRHRPLSDRAKGLGSIVVGALWPKCWEAFKWSAEWLADKMFGDTAFRWLGDAMSPATQAALDIASSWGVTAVLLVVGLYFFFRTDRTKGLGSVPPRRPATTMVPSGLPKKPDAVAHATPTSREPIKASKPSSRWDKYQTSDLQRIDDALYAMFELLSQRAGRAADVIYQQLDNFRTAYPQNQHGYAVTLRALHWDVRRVIGELSELQHKTYELYAQDLTSVYDNVGFSDFTGKMDRFLILIEGTDGVPHGTMMSLLLEKKDEAQTYVREFNGWIARSKTRVREAREEIAKLRAER